MHPELTRRFHTAIRDEAAVRFGLTSLTALNAFENFVYEGISEVGEELVLRISHSLRRTFDYTLEELEFVRFLAAGGLPVAQPVLAETGQFAERIEDGSSHYFVASAFERAPGIVFDDAPPLKAALWKPPLFQQLGELFARLHNRAQHYKPSYPRFQRQQWHEYDVVDVARFVPADEHVVRGRTAAIIERLQRLPRSGDVYGLIHADLHPHNFCFHDGRITVFDFDNCEYAWFVKDIAVLIYYVARGVPAGQREAEVAGFLPAFLAGYRSVRRCDREWLAALPDLLALQRCMNYALFHQYRDKNELDEADRDAWRRFRRDIEADAPVLHMDFASM
jgi:Ser/Thr protein kinase RdoA (MazF antagonist)